MWGCSAARAAWWRRSPARAGNDARHSRLQSQRRSRRAPRASGRIGASRALHGVACDIGWPRPSAQVGSSSPRRAGKTPSRLSGELSAGFGDARGRWPSACRTDRRITCATASEIAGQTFDDLNVMLIEFAGGAGSPGSSSLRGAGRRVCARSSFFCGGLCGRIPRRELPLAVRFLGHSDELFIRGDVPMTKQEVRAVALTKLRLTATDTVWDVGAGTGSVSTRRSPSRERGRYGRSSNAAGVRLIRENADAFRVRQRACGPRCRPEAARETARPRRRVRRRERGELPSIVEAALEKNSLRFACACHASPLRRSPRRARAPRVRGVRPASVVPAAPAQPVAPSYEGQTPCSSSARGVVRGGCRGSLPDARCESPVGSPVCRGTVR